MILQKDLSLFRLDNQHPYKFAPEKYEYQLRRNGQLICSQYSDNIYTIGKVSEDLTLELLTPADCDSRTIEDENSFLVNVKTA